MIRFPNGGELFDFQRDASEWLLNNTGLESDCKTLIVKDQLVVVRQLFF